MTQPLCLRATCLALVLVSLGCSSSNPAERALTAVAEGRTEVAIRLIARDPTIAKHHYSQLRGEALLHVAARHQNPTVCSALIDANPSVDLTDNRGRTALFYASTSEVAELLVSAKASVNHHDKIGLTPLHSVPSASVCNALIAAGAQIEARADNGMTPLLGQCFWGTEESVNCLLDHGADTAATCSNGLGCLHCVAAGELPAAAKVRISQRLVGTGVTVNALSVVGETAVE